jgi:hypothetical protein
MWITSWNDDSERIVRSDAFVSICTTWLAVGELELRSDFDFILVA